MTNSGLGTLVLILVGCLALTGCKAGASNDGSIHKCVILDKNTIRVYNYWGDDENIIIPKNNIAGVVYKELSENEYEIDFSLRFPVLTPMHGYAFPTCNGNLDIIKDWIKNDK